jgi:hypothetical protein
MMGRVLTILWFVAVGMAVGQVNRLAKVAYVEGQVEIIRSGSQSPERAEPGMTLFPGDLVQARSGKCTLNFTASGILRLSPGTSVLLPVPDSSDKGSELLRMMVGKTGKNFRQLVGLDPNEVFEVRADRWESTISASQSAGTIEDEAVAEYRALLPAVLQAERKPWHTRFEFIAIAVKTGTGYRVAYKTYCVIEKGPDAGKDYACYELDTVLDVGEVKKAVADMKRRMGR